ncbi:L,D-transpeptidase, partial [Mesorhizobium sp. M1D.F.Ca.ET.234.01.1.1]
SHGCVRLHTDAAADFYQLVEAFGPGNTSIVIVK